MHFSQILSCVNRQDWSRVQRAHKALKPTVLPRACLLFDSMHPTSSSQQSWFYTTVKLYWLLDIHINLFRGYQYCFIASTVQYVIFKKQIWYSPYFSIFCKYPISNIKLTLLSLFLRTFLCNHRVVYFFNSLVRIVLGNATFKRLPTICHN